jgi:hypothetical protein
MSFKTLVIILVFPNFLCIEDVETLSSCFPSLLGFVSLKDMLYYRISGVVDGNYLPLLISQCTNSAP